MVSLYPFIILSHALPIPLIPKQALICFPSLQIS